MLLIINIHSLSQMILYEANAHKEIHRRDLQVHHFAAKGMVNFTHTHCCQYQNTISYPRELPGLGYQVE